jgi:hypothetical protein
MAALCHLDTSKWNADHPSFEMVHTHPGGAPVCHIVPYAHLPYRCEGGQRLSQQGSEVPPVYLLALIDAPVTLATG